MSAKDVCHNGIKWYFCPHCGRKLIKYSSGATAERLYLKCRQCGKEVEIRIKSKVDC